MAIIVDYSDWDNVHDYIYQTLSNRKFQFKKSLIFINIKQQLLSLNVPSDVLDCAQFEMLFNNVLEELVKDCVLYRAGSIYTPARYIFLKTFDTRFANLLYFQSEPPAYINISTNSEVTTSDISPRDYLLCNGLKEDIFFQSDIPLNEVCSLYYTLITEGAEKYEAIEFILNYYNAKILPANDLCRIVSVKKKSLNKGCVQLYD